MSKQKEEGSVALLDEAKHEIVGQTTAFTMQVVPGGEEVPPNDRVVIVAQTEDGNVRLALTEDAHRQVAETTGIPIAYYRDLLATSPDLLATNVNVRFRERPVKRRLSLTAPEKVNDQEKERLERTAASRIAWRCFE
jgi:hypothetical protein